MSTVNLFEPRKEKRAAPRQRTIAKRATASKNPGNSLLRGKSESQRRTSTKIPLRIERPKDELLTPVRTTIDQKTRARVNGVTYMQGG